MVKSQFSKGGLYEWPPLSFSEGGKSRQGGQPRREDEPEGRETPEEMIRSLQGIFCKGRYRSWTVRQG
jgi:hypothetical protein